MIYYISIGSNIKDRIPFLKQAIDKLKKIATIIKVSSIYETEPFGLSEQEYFLNTICIIDFQRNPFRLLRKLKTIEISIGRNKTNIWGPRKIDLDIIDWNGQSLDTNILAIPHNEMVNRKFVLIPLKEIEPEFKSKSGLTIDQIIDRCNDNLNVNLYHIQW